MKDSFKNLFLTTISVLLSLFLIEILLRIWGFETFKYLETNSPQPSIYKNDKILGWSNKEGLHQIRIDDNNTVSYRFHKDGSRYSGRDFDVNNSDKKITILGGSFALGQAVNDNQTFAFYVQNNLKQYKIKNYGVGGHGTYQSYLRLKELFKSNQNIDYVIYSFIDPHEKRNMGDASWSEWLSKLSKKPVYIPYVTLDGKNKLTEHPPREYLVLPLSGQSVLISKIQKKIMRMILYSSKDDTVFVTKQLILKMKKLSDLNGSKFIFVNLNSKISKIDDYSNFSKANNINFVNCQIYLGEDLIVKNDGHPNDRAHKKYGNCILKALK